MTPTKLAFSLVELSIVLVILGLLVGGVLAGQSLIRAAELRSVSTDFTRYQAAMQTFRDKYFFIPGDMTNATQFWGTSTACGGASATGTCNGDGDGKVSDYSNPAVVGSGVNFNPYEVFTFWQQLALAGLIEGKYAATGTDYIAGTNVPKARIANAYYGFPADMSSSDIAIRFGGGSTYPDYRTTPLSIALGKNCSDTSGSGVIPVACGGVLKTEEAWNIDTKMDDGKPNSGKIAINVADGTFSGITLDSAWCAQIGNAYILSSTTNLCPLGFQMF